MMSLAFASFFAMLFAVAVYQLTAARTAARTKQFDLIMLVLLLLLAIDLPFCISKSMAEKLSQAWSLSQTLEEF